MNIRIGIFRVVSGNKLVGQCSEMHLARAIDGAGAVGHWRTCNCGVAAAARLGVLIPEQLREHILFEDVDAHGRNVRQLLRLCGAETCRGAKCCACAPCRASAAMPCAGSSTAERSHPGDTQPGNYNLRHTQDGSVHHHRLQLVTLRLLGKILGVAATHQLTTLV